MSPEENFEAPEDDGATRLYEPEFLNKSGSKNELFCAMLLRLWYYLL